VKIDLSARHEREAPVPFGTIAVVNAMVVVVSVGLAFAAWAFWRVSLFRALFLVLGGVYVLAASGRPRVLYRVSALWFYPVLFYRAPRIGITDPRMIRGVLFAAAVLFIAISFFV
jgi:hypothetical protein